MRRALARYRRRLSIRLWRLWRQVCQHPLEACVAAMAAPAGVTALIVGSRVSEAMSRVMPGQGNAVRLWGIALAAGGALTAWGLGTRRTWWERQGLRLLAAACALYAVTVVLGLHLGGVIAGSISGGCALGCLIRVHASLREDAARLALKDVLNQVQEQP